MGDVARPLLLRRGALAQIVYQRGEANPCIGTQPGRLLQHHHGVQAAVLFRVVVFRLRHTEELLQLREDARQGAAVAQHFKKTHRALFTQGVFRLLPHPFRHQRIHLAIRHHLFHQLVGGVGNMKAPLVKACSIAGDAQNPHRIFGEGVGDVAQFALLQIVATIEGVDQIAIAILGHGVDGQVAALEILFQSDVRVGVKAEAVITRCGLAFGAGEGVLLFGLRMEKDREILAHRLVTEIEHLLRCGTDHHPVAIPWLQSQQFVTDGAADEIDLQRLNLFLPVSVAGGNGCACLHSSDNRGLHFRCCAG